MLKHTRFALFGRQTSQPRITVQQAVLWAPVIVLVLCFLLWIAAVSQVDQTDLGEMTDIGLISVLPIPYFVALGILIISGCSLIYWQSHRELMIGLHIVLLILIIHATPPLLYGTLRYSWTWKHVGIVDYIARHGQVNPTIERLSAYHNWPGFFTLSLLLTELAGLETPYEFAIWATPFFDLLFLGAMILIVRSLTDDRRLAWLCVWFFYLTNWVGQDYFAPQSLAYFMHLVVVGICLRWFSKHYVPEKSTLKQWLRFKWVTNLAHTLLTFGQKADPPEIKSTRFQRGGALIVLLIIFAAIASTHQLTPFMTIAGILGLVVAQRSTAHSLPFMLGIIAFMWIFYVAVAFLHPTAESIVESFGQLSNTRLIVLAKASDGQRLVAIMGRALTVGVVLLGGLGTLRLMILKQWRLSAIALAGGPFILLGANSYGGEMIFRVYLFALPFVIFLGANLFYPKPNLGRSLFTLLLTIVISGGMLTAFFFGYYGKERQYRFSPKEVEASRFLFEVAPEGSLIIEGARNYPTQFRNYEFYQLVPVNREPTDSSMRIVNNPLNNIERWMSNDAYVESYMIITRSQKAEVDMLGGLPFGSLAVIEQKMTDSPKFDVIFHNEDATIFMLAEGIRDGR